MYICSTVDAGRAVKQNTMQNIKTLAKGRTNKDVNVPARSERDKMAGAQNRGVMLPAGTELEIVGFNKDKTLNVKSPIDPDIIITIAADAVEIYNEGLAIWQGLKQFFAKVGAFFANIPSFFKKK